MQIAFSLSDVLAAMELIGHFNEHILCRLD